MPSSNSVEACPLVCAPLVHLLRFECYLLLGLCFNAGQATENPSDRVLPLEPVLPR